MATRTRRKSVESRVAKRLTALAIDAPFVVSARSRKIAKAGLSPKADDLAEMHQMVSEKLIAMSQSVWAMQAAMIKAQLEWIQHGLKPRRPNAVAPRSALGTMSEWSTSAWPSARRALAQTLDAGLKPVQTKASANAKRLRKG